MHLLQFLLCIIQGVMMCQNNTYLFMSCLICNGVLTFKLFHVVCQADINKKQQLKDILSEAEVKKTKKAANDQLICTLREELSHINMEENSLRGGTFVIFLLSSLSWLITFSFFSLILRVKMQSGLVDYSQARPCPIFSLVTSVTAQPG